MKITMLGWEFPPLLIGGLGVYTYNLTKALSKRSLKIDFFMPKTKIKIKRSWLNIIQVPYNRYLNFKETEKAYPYYNIKNDIKYLKINTEKSYSKIGKYNLLCAKKIIKNHKIDPYDVIHCQAWYGLKAGILVKKKLNVPLVTTLHTTEHLIRRKGKENKKIIKLEKYSIKYSDKIIVPSKILKKTFIEKYDLDKEKIKIIYNGIDEIFFKKRKKRLRSKKRVLFLGRLRPYKGCNFYLKAAKKILEKDKKVEFFVVGWEKNFKEYLDLAKKLRIEKNVKFIRKIPYKKIPNVYYNSDIYVLPSVFDAFGITVLEAMACGLPVIISKAAGVSEVVKNCIKVDYNDIDSIAENIIKLLNNDKLRKSLGKKARKEAKKFLWKNIAKETIKIYKEVNR